MYFLKKTSLLLLGVLLSNNQALFCATSTSSTSWKNDTQSSPGTESAASTDESDNDNTSEDKTDENAASSSGATIYPNCGLGFYYEDGHCIPLNKAP